METGHAGALLLDGPVDIHLAEERLPCGKSRRRGSPAAHPAAALRALAHVAETGVDTRKGLRSGTSKSWITVPRARWSCRARSSWPGNARSQIVLVDDGEPRSGGCSAPRREGQVQRLVGAERLPPRAARPPSGTAALPATGRPCPEGEAPDVDLRGRNTRPDRGSSRPDEMRHAQRDVLDLVGRVEARLEHGGRPGRTSGAVS